MIDPGARPGYGAASGAIAVVLYLVGGLLTGTPAEFGGPPSEAVAYFEENSTRIGVGSAFFAGSAPFLVWFLATIASLARASGPAAERAGAIAFGCGIAALALFMADVAALAVAALRPENMAAAPELAAALLDFSFLAIAMASFLTSAVFAAIAVLALKHGALWPVWVGRLAALAAVACALRVGNLLTSEGPFAGAGALGFYLPVVAFVVGILAASITLLTGARSAQPTPD